jgi:DNA-directed RNA polymerase specialized sigma24 family protein
LIEFGAIALLWMAQPTDDRGSVTALGFARLLERLHPDRDEAAHEYERLRHALVKFFDWQGVWPADECADTALDRLARRLQDTTVDDVKKYVYGIARLVLLERRRAPQFAPIDDALQTVAAGAPSPVQDDADRLQSCFDRCLDALPHDGRSLVLGYYDGERSAKISNRRRLATALGVTESALRSRVQRLRDRLAQCVQACSSQTVSETL